MKRHNSTQKWTLIENEFLSDHYSGKSNNDIVIETSEEFNQIKVAKQAQRKEKNPPTSQVEQIKIDRRVNRKDQSASDKTKNNTRSDALMETAV